MLAERGLSAAAETPTRLDAGLVEDCDVIVTMGCGETCPVFPGKRWSARRRKRRRWMAWHGAGMAGSYITLLTGFYVDNGPQLPVWDRLPHATYWLLPAVVGIPLTWRAVKRTRQLPGRSGVLLLTNPLVE